MDRVIISINILTYLKFNEIEGKSKSEAKVLPARRFQGYPTFFLRISEMSVTGYLKTTSKLKVKSSRVCSQHVEEKVYNPAALEGVTFHENFVVCQHVSYVAIIPRSHSMHNASKPGGYFVCNQS
jgi:hypothetical protein